MVNLTGLQVHDIRFPTSEGMHGSDSMHPDPDYSCAYVLIETDSNGLTGHGLTFTIGRGTEVVCMACEALQHFIVGKTLEEITANMGTWWRSIIDDGQLRWLGPHKGAIHLAAGAIVNAVWDLWAKVEGKPLWRLLYDMTPEQLLQCVDFRWITDAITPEEALIMLKEKAKGKEERLQQLQERGYPAYTTSAGWLGYTEDELRQKCRDGLKAGWTYFKAKVGVDIDDDIRRIAIIREEIGKDNILMVDANQRWNVPEAIENMIKLSPSSPYFIEEPTCADDILGHRAIREALKPYNIKVATGEVCHNRVMFKQFLSAGALDICQIDSCRVAGVNELIAIYLMALRYNTPVWPHAGGVGLCEYVQHLAAFDFLCVSGKLNRVEYVNHLHEHFKTPVVMENGAYVLPKEPGYSIEMHTASISDFTFPTGAEWQKRIQNNTSPQKLPDIYTKVYGPKGDKPPQRVELFQ